MESQYLCKKHGENGNPNCKECIENLKELANDNNALLLNENGKPIN